MIEHAVPVITLLSVFLLVMAGLHDAAARTIPNWIPLALLAAGIVLRLWQGNLGPGLGNAAMLFAIFVALWRRGFIGGGDMKLIPAVALVLPPSDVLRFILFMTLAGGVLALIYIGLSHVVRRPRPGPRHGLLARVLKAEAWRMHRRGPLPYAVAIAFGALPIVFNIIPQ